MKRIVLYYILPSILLLVLLTAAVLTGRSWKQQARAYEKQMEAAREELSFLRNNQEILRQNSIQLRQYMNLPPLVFDDPAAQGASGDSDAPVYGNFELAAYDAVAFLTEHNETQEDLKTYSLILEDSGFSSLLKQMGLTYRKTGSFSGSLSKGEKSYFTLEYDQESEDLSLRSALGDADITGAPFSDDISEFLKQESAHMDQLYSTAAALNRELLRIYQDRDLRNGLRELQLRLGSPVAGKAGEAVPVLRIDDSRLMVLSTDIEDSTFTMKDSSFATLDELKTGLWEYVTTQDIRTASKVQDDLVEEEMILLLKDPAFLQRLEDLGYRPAGTPREDNDYIYYDLINSEGTADGSLALQKEFAEVYLMDGDDIPVRSLRTFTAEHRLTFNFQLEDEASVEDLADYRLAEGSETFLLIGSHEHNADTMILLYADSDAGQMRMLSVPRDLYYRGQKINAIYRQQGPDALMSALSSITGLEIRNYVGIDMYAFIDVVNILGGIDVTLDEALVDPTYKVRENGRWSTLYYPKGTHHLDGIAALRIARSRHTSSDFERAVRQQKVIAALKDTVTDMGLGDINKIYDIVQTSGKYVESNLSTADMVKYFLSYKDFDISGQHVMNTDNVLYATYTNLYRLSEEEQKQALENPDFFKGGWIVLPKNNDWSIIKTYIRSVLIN
ncbi:MAG: LCP family protein [Spirochaetales bacterium]|nr:LCP family protein [Spirochaetales bacterium]